MLKKYKHDIALLSVVVIWGVNFPVLKAAIDVLNLHVVNALRFTVAALLLGGIYFWMHRDQDLSLAELLRRHFLSLAGLGLLGYFFYQLAFIVGVHHTTAGNAALIMAGAPLFTALLSRLIKVENLGPQSWFGLFISLSGTILVVLAGAGAVGIQAGSLMGNMLMLLSAVLWGAYTGLTRLLLNKMRAIEVTFFGLMFALPFLYAMAIPYAGDVHWQAVDIWVWLAIVFSGGLSIGLAFIIWNSAVKRVGPSNTAVYSNLVPFIAVIGGILFLGEPLSWLQVAGGTLIIGGLVVLRRARRKKSPILEGRN